MDNNPLPAAERPEYQLRIRSVLRAKVDGIFAGGGLIDGAGNRCHFTAGVISGCCSIAYLTGSLSMAEWDRIVEGDLSMLADGVPA